MRRLVAACAVLTVVMVPTAHAGVEVIPEPGGGGSTGGGTSRTCKGTKAVIAGKGLCLRAGLRCDPKQDRLFKRYGYRCRKAKARRGHKRPRLSKLTLGDAARRRFGDAVPVASNGKIDKATALQAFVASFGPLPGVKRQKGVVEPTHSGTGPLHWLLAHRSELTAKQRAVLDKRVAELFPEVTASANPAEAQASLDTAVDRIAAHVGPLSLTPKVVFAAGSGANDALATAELVSGGVCKVTVLPGGQQQVAAALFTTMAHEAFHCFQDQWDPGGYQADRAWMREGQAAWVEATISVEDNPNYRDPATKQYWDDWLTSPTAPLFVRTYTAIGFFAQVARSGIDPWSKFKPMLQAGSNEAAYNVVVPSAVGSEVLRSWGTGYFRSPPLGKDWDFTGPQIPQTPGKISKGTLTNSSSIFVGAPERAADPQDIVLKADVVQVSVDGGTPFGQMQDSTGVTRPIEPGQFCARPAGCQCEAGAPPSGGDMKGRLLIGLTSSSDEAIVQVHGESLEDYCKKAPPAASLTFGSGSTGQRGDCTTSFAGSPGSFWAYFTDDGSSGFALQLTVKPYEGPREYRLTGGAALSSPNAQVSDGKGNVWESRGMPEGDAAGTFTITGESGGVITGSVSAQLRNDKTDSRISAQGSFTCKAD